MEDRDLLLYNDDRLKNLDIYDLLKRAYEKFESDPIKYNKAGLCWTIIKTIDKEIKYIGLDKNEWTYSNFMENYIIPGFINACVKNGAKLSNTYHWPHGLEQDGFEEAIEYRRNTLKQLLELYSPKT